MSLRDSRRLPGLSTLLTIVIAAATLLVTGLMVWIVGGIATTDIKRTVGGILAERARTAASRLTFCPQTCKGRTHWPPVSTPVAC